MIEWQYDDGGRQAAGYRGDASDCACRAIAIATGLPYQDVYERLAAIGKLERTGKRKRGKSHPRTGVYKEAIHRFMQSIHWEWTPTMGIGTGCRVHVRRDELPATGPLVLNLSKHFAAVVDGVLYDTHDSSRDGTRCVYGYWRPPAPFDLEAIPN